jgi:hypothetical protein
MHSILSTLQPLLISFYFVDIKNYLPEELNQEEVDHRRLVALFQGLQDDTWKQELIQGEAHLAHLAFEQTEPVIPAS